MFMCSHKPNLRFFVFFCLFWALFLRVAVSAPLRLALAPNGLFLGSANAEAQRHLSLNGRFRLVPVDVLSTKPPHCLDGVETFDAAGGAGQAVASFGCSPPPPKFSSL